MDSKGPAIPFHGFRPGGKGMIFLSCIFIAAAIWVINALSKTYQTSYTYFISVGDAEKKGEQVTATFRGQGFSLVRLYYRLSGNHYADHRQEAQLYTKPFTDSLVGDLRNAIQVTGAEPSFINSSISRGQYTKKVPVRSRVTVEYGNEYGAALPLMFRPDSVEISGTEAAFDSIKYIETVPLQIKDLKRSLFRSVELKSPSASIRLRQPRIWMYVPVEKYTEAQAEVAVTLPGRKSNLRPVPSKVLLTYLVPLSKYKEVNSSRFTVVANASGTPDKNLCSLSLTRKPYFVKHVTLHPAEVSILIFE